MSMSAAEKLFGVQLKIERAKQHIVDLEGTLRAFYDSKPYKVGAKHDTQTRKLIYYVASVEDTPPRIALVAGDALQNLRAALDHLAYQLLLDGTGGEVTPKQLKNIAFPIFDSATKYKSESPRKVQGVRKDAVDAIDAIEPYKGGKGHQLWVLHELNNTDKHRLLITVGSAFRSVNLGAHMWPAMQRSIRELLGNNEAVVPVLDAYFRPADRLCPLKEGDELFIDAPDAEVNEKMDFRFDVALGEPQVIQGEPLVETIHHLADFVDNIATQFGSLL
jgi:hypothetical protein